MFWAWFLEIWFLCLSSTPTTCTLIHSHPHNHPSLFLTCVPYMSNLKLELNYLFIQVFTFSKVSLYVTQMNDHDQQMKQIKYKEYQISNQISTHLWYEIKLFTFVFFFQFVYSGRRFRPPDHAGKMRESHRI